MRNAAGLEDVVAVTTAIGRVDGERGELVVRGRSMEEMARELTYEDALRLLWEPETNADATSFDDLGQRRAEVFAQLQAKDAFVDPADPMDFQRRALSNVRPSGNPVDDAVTAAAVLAVAAPAWWRTTNGASPVPPDASVSQATDYLRMLTGEAPGARRVRALNTYLVAVTDHGMNASTFTARIIASTQSDLLSAVSGAIGALKGPLHGGAPGPVLDMLDAIGTADDAEAWLRSELDAGRRIMGMGHRVYRVRDPRARIFEEALSRLERRGTSPRLELARAVERTAERLLAERHPDRSLKANVEFYTAVLLEAIGVPRELFTATFAVGRVLGWCAHVMEQRSTGRLIRPRSAYTGLLPSRTG